MIKPLIRISLTLVATLVALLVITLPAPAIGASAGTLKPYPTPANSSSTIYFVPIGEISSLSVDELVRFYKQKYQLNIKTLAGLQLEKTGGYRQGKQFAAEDLIQFMKSSHPRLSGNPRVILIGITEEDIFIRKYSWQFAFGYRENRFAVVSSARMNPVNFGQPKNHELLHTRLRKMITKNIGILYFRLPQNNNPRSVLFRSILGLEELDRVGEDF